MFKRGTLTRGAPLYAVIRAYSKPPIWFCKHQKWLFLARSNDNKPVFRNPYNASIELDSRAGGGIGGVRRFSHKLHHGYPRGPPETAGPSFLLPGPIGRKGLIGQKVCLIQGRRRGPRPFLRFARTRRPHSSARAESAPPPRMGIARPGRSRAPAPRARRPRRTRFGASRRSAAGRGRVRRSAASAPPSSKGPIGPRKKAARRRRKGRRRNRGDPDSAAGSRSRHRRPAGGARRPEAPLRGGGPRGDAAIEPASRTPKKGPIYSAGVRRPRPAPPRARPTRPAAPDL